jgi:hypothetical protein
MFANLLFAWSWILAGLLTGIGLGLFFHREEWLGGYNSWRRRMLRLGHIAFFGTGLINLMAAISAQLWLASPNGTLLQAASWFLIVGAFAMPVICFLSAWKKPFRNLFFIPVIGLVGGVGCFLVLLVQGAPG